MCIPPLERWGRRTTLGGRVMSDPTPDAILSADEQHRRLAWANPAEAAREYEALRAALLVETRRADELEDDLLLCMEVRALALEEAALEFQAGPDGQDYLDRSRMIRRWVEAAYERHGDGERAAHERARQVLGIEPQS